LAQQNPNTSIVGGELIHNPSETARLSAEFNVNPAPDADTIPSSSAALIRAHGISNAVEKSLAARGIKIIDATCPNVKNIHKIVAELSEQGFQIFLFGTKSHPEVDGIIDRANAPVIVIESAADLCEINVLPRAALVSQTTKNLTEFGKIAAELSQRSDELIIRRTICPATRMNQEAAAELAKLCDIMIVIGGKNSSNTKQLRIAAEPFCSAIHLIESADELQAEWFAGKEFCGLAAGLSTPDYLTNEVEKRIKKLVGAE
jgi:4-hydroxy-3-methylbut-2-enyl diphosphate reductase